MQKESVLFGSCLFIFIMHQILENCFHVQVKMVDNYADALVCMPIILQLVVWERRLLLKDTCYHLPLLHIFGYFILISLIAELLFPKLSNRFTADSLDVVCYAIGSFVFIAINTYKRTH
jgi:hypothetical protein